MKILKPILDTKTFFQKLVLGMFLVFSVGSAHAQDTTPEKSIEVAVQNLLDEFTNRRSELQSDKTALYTMVDRLARPHFDFERISKLILAKNWKKADAAQRTAFTDEFRTLLIRTYATALFQYTGKEKMLFEPGQVKERKGVKSATVNSEVKLSDGPGIPVIYSMILSDDQKWKIYNLKIAGVNMVTNYRQTYGASIRSQGIDGLIKSMREANART